MGWQDLSTDSHYRTAVAIEQELKQGHVQEATAGIKELIDALGRSEKRALKGHLVRLMAHVMKWQTQPERRSYSWASTIYSTQEEIFDIQAETPSLTDAVLREMWDRCFLIAKREAEGDMDQTAVTTTLSWYEVFDEAYEKQ
jgi:hypothetical protein